MDSYIPWNITQPQKDGNNTIPFAATWMGLEIVMLSELLQKMINAI